MSGILENININKLINYYENPRHAVGSNEKDTMKKLFDAVGIQYMLNLAEDIQKNGLLGSQHVTVVYSKEIDKYVVYEGNRRIAALKLLHNPEFFDFLDKPTIERAKKIVGYDNVLDTLNCYVTDEKEAFFIMERLHSGDDKGRGTKQWTSREKEIFKVRQSGEKNLSYLIDFYVKKYFNNFDITSILPFTTIQRIFNNREIKKKIGLDTTEESSFTKERLKLVIETSKWVIEEANAKGIAVTRLFNKARNIENEIIPWIEQYQDNGNTKNVLNNENDGKDKSKNALYNDIDNIIKKQANGIHSEYGVTKDKNTPISSTAIQAHTLETPIKSNKNEVGGSGSNKNLPYFFQGLSYGNLDPNDANTHGVSAVCREIQLFSDKKMVSTFPISAAFLTRSIIEHAIKYYSKKHKIQGQDKYIWNDIENITQLNKVIAKYNKNLPNYITDSVIRQYFVALFGDYEKNADPLNWVIHRPSEFKLDAIALTDLPRKGLLALINYFIS